MLPINELQNKWKASLAVASYIQAREDGHHHPEPSMWSCSGYQNNVATMIAPELKKLSSIAYQNFGRCIAFVDVTNSQEVGMDEPNTNIPYHLF